FPKMHPFAEAFRRKLRPDLGIAEKLQGRAPAVGQHQDIELLIPRPKPVADPLLERLAFAIGSHLKGVEAAARPQKSWDALDRPPDDLLAILACFGEHQPLPPDPR